MRFLKLKLFLKTTINQKLLNTFSIPIVNFILLNMKVVVIEKDVHSFKKLQRFLNESLRNVSLLRHANSLVEGVGLIKEVYPDIVFISFLFNTEEAFDALEEVSQIPFRLFFTNGLTETSGILANNFTYHKRENPVDEVKLHKNLFLDKHRPMKTIQTNANSKIFLPTGGAHFAITPDDIIKCVAEGNYTSFFLKDSKFLVSHPIKYYESLLKGKGFFRINRSVLVNISHITVIYKKETIVLTNNEKLVVSRRNKEKLKNLIDHLS